MFNLFTLVSLSLLTVLSFTSCKSSEEQERLVLVKVNEKTLKAKGFADQLAFKLKNYDALLVKDSTNLERIKKEIVNDFILKTVTENWAKENEIAVSKQELHEQVQKIRAHYPDDTSFRRSLAQEHFSFKAWKQGLKFTLLQKKIMAHLRSNLPTPTEGELKDYYNKNKTLFHRKKQIRVQQIVVKKKENAERILKEIKKNGDFGALAEKYSIAPEASSQGKTDWIDIDTLEIFQKASNLPVNGPAKIFKSPFGHHILKVLEKRRAGPLDYPLVKEQIAYQLNQQLEQAAYTEWLDQQIRRHKVFKDDGSIARITIETKEN